MQKKYINMSSVTFALKAEKLLLNKKIKCSVKRTPSKFNSRGCGYSVIVDNYDSVEAIKILKDNSVSILSVQEIEE